MATSKAMDKAGWLGLADAERDVLLASTVLKVLLFPSYRSTDFEVHRNWLAITHSLPLSKWYFDTTSKWTLDYPPFFAYFERALSWLASLVDPQITRLDNLGYSSASCIAFQRLSVIASELVLGSALLRLARRPSPNQQPSAAFAVAACLFLHPGLLIVDHIHFQYNGFLLGILLWSFHAVREGRNRSAAFFFAVLLNFKHIFIYLAPPYLIFLFRSHCFPPPSRSFSPAHLVELGTIVLGVTTLSFGPFMATGGVQGVAQIVSRLFPFQRGLNHAYWAGNAWAIVSTVDRVLVRYLLVRGVHVDRAAVHSTSRGLVGDTTFGVVPEITPRTCFAITLAFSLVFATKLWVDPSYARFLRAVCLSAFTSFLFGWHVHEKAALLFLVPLTLTATDDYEHFRTWLVATAAGTYGLFPLLIDRTETPVKVIYTLVWMTLTFSILARGLHRPNPTAFSMLVRLGENIYVGGFLLVQIYVSFLHRLVFPPSSSGSVPRLRAFASSLGFGGEGSAPDLAVATAPEVGRVEHEVKGGMEFLPLMLTSVYCALGISWAFVRLSYLYLVR